MSLDSGLAEPSKIREQKVAVHALSREGVQEHLNTCRMD